MKIIEKDFIVGGAKCGTLLHYDEVEPELQITPETPQNTRVLPSQFFYEKRLFFHLVKRYEPGEKRTFPKGGFEIRDEGGAIRSYHLDQVVIHPIVIKHKKTLDKMARRAEKEQKKRERRLKKVEREIKPKHGRRGRPALDPSVKAAREAEQTARSLKSGGKRGRPKGSGTTTPKQPKQTGGKRGRPALSAEAKAAKLASKATIRARSGGKRGRPKANR